jgi:hypothetical protein
MTERNARAIRLWFAQYVREYTSGDADVRRNLLLKESHTRRVCGEALAIGRALGLSAADLRIVEVIVLLHDVGRFEQFARYHTFADSRSENHAKLTLKILRRRRVLERFDPRTREIIRRAILYHNLRAVPPVRDPRIKFFARILRDADKLDIWKLVIRNYYAPERRKNKALSIGLPDGPDITRGVYEDLLAGRIVDNKNLRNLNDLKLFQLGWVLDVNFVPTLRAVRRRRYLEKIRGVLPATAQVDEVCGIVRQHMERRIREEKPLTK